MGFQGQLDSVNLTDIFQTLNMNRQTGTFTVTGPKGMTHVYFDGGQVSVCTASAVDGLPFLLHALVRKTLLSEDQAQDLNARLAAAGQGVREVVLASGYIAEADLDEICAWCIEEIVCPLIEWKDGDFTFSDGAPSAELESIDVVAMGEVKLQTTQLVLEATRREDEWKRIRDVIPDAEALYVVDGAGRANLRTVESDAEMLKVLRFLDGRHALDEISRAVGVPRFDTYAIVAQLVLANVARIAAPQELIDDAVELRKQGDPERAYALLDGLAASAKIPEVIRPLAELCVELKQTPRAVELYLELIQQAQDQGQLESALADLDIVIRLSPDDPDLHFDRAQVLSELNRPEEAAQSFVAAAQAYLSTRDVPQAIDACHRAKNLVPRSPDPHRFLAKAYLIDGQTENAVIEYKSLWHALLSSQRPRKALEVLKETLDSDCRFAGVKDQVLSHAQSSEAIKTGSAARMLIYVVALIVIGFGGITGWHWVQRDLLKNHAQQELNEIKARAQKLEDQGKHQELIASLQDFVIKNGSTYSDLGLDADRLRNDVVADSEKRGASELDKARLLGDSGNYDGAIALYSEIQRAYAGTPIAKQAENGLLDAGLKKKESEIRKRVDDVKRLWEQDGWDQAFAALNQQFDDPHLPPSVRPDLDALKKQWAAMMDAAEQWFRRGERLELAGRKKEAHESFKRAIAAKGGTYQEKARDRLDVLERQFAEELGKAYGEAVDRGDDQQAFVAVDELRALAKEAVTPRVQDYLASQFALLYIVQVDHPHTYLMVKHGAREEKLVAPPDTNAAWTHVFEYRLGETLALEARHPGFTTLPISVSAEARRNRQIVALKRGPVWQSEFKGEVATTAPVTAGKFILLLTNKSTLEVVDSGLGAVKTMTFSRPPVSEFHDPPFIYQGIAYLAMDGRIVAVDINSHTEQLNWPDQGRELDLLPGALWVQEHTLIQGQLQIFAGGTRNRVHAFAIEDGMVKTCPSAALEGGTTGPVLVDSFDASHSTLYVPSRSTLAAFDVQTVTEHSPLKQVYLHQISGEIVDRPVRALVKGQPSILIADNSGTVIALNANPAVPDGARAIGSWPIESTPLRAPVPRLDGTAAYVSTNDGQVVALDLAQPGRLLWRFPAKGTLGSLAGAPAIGLRGIYVANAKGMLYCIDPSGAERWRADLGSGAVAGILAYEGRVYVPTKGGSLLCFEEGDE